MHGAVRRRLGAGRGLEEGADAGRHEVVAGGRAAQLVAQGDQRAERRDQLVLARAQRVERRPEVVEVGEHGLLAAGEQVADRTAEALHAVEQLADAGGVVGEAAQRRREQLERVLDDRRALVEGVREPAEGVEDAVEVVLVLVEVRDDRLQLDERVAGVAGAALEGRVELGGDRLQVRQAAAVEQGGHRREGVLDVGRGVGRRCGTEAPSASGAPWSAPVTDTKSSPSGVVKRISNRARRPSGNAFSTFMSTCATKWLVAMSVTSPTTTPPSLTFAPSVRFWTSRSRPRSSRSARSAGRRREVLQRVPAPAQHHGRRRDGRHESPPPHREPR